jgi:hypothetical protein
VGEFDDRDEHGYLRSVTYPKVSVGIHPLEIAKAPTHCFGFPYKRGEDPVGIDPGHKIIKLPDPTKCNKPLQKGAECVGYVTSVQGVARSCMCNAMNALVVRHLADRPPCSANWAEAHQIWDKHIFALKVATSDYFDTLETEWIKRWPKEKQDAILKSVEVDNLRAMDVKYFVKFEVGLGSKARGIQMYANLHTQAIYAPIVASMQKAFTKYLYRREIVPGIYVTLGSGLNNVDLGKWLGEALAHHPGGVFYERDGKAWDATMTEEGLQAKWDLYKKIMPYPDFVELMRQGVNATGRYVSRGWGKAKWKSRGTVKSGHNDTSLGNGIENITIVVNAMMSLGLTGDVIVNGDDLLVLSHTDFDLDAFMEAEAVYGIRPEADKFYHWGQVEFASGIFFEYSDNKFVFAPKPGRLLARLFWTVKPPSKKQRVNFQHSVALGHMPIMGTMPVIGNFLRSHLVEGAKVIQVRKLDLCQEEIPFHRDMMIEQFCRRYTITPDELLEAERVFDRPCSGPAFVSHPVLDRITKVDMASLPERFKD